MHMASRLRELAASPWLPWLRRGFIPLALAFLVYSAYLASDHLRPLLAVVSVPHLLLACMLWSLAQWVGPLASVVMARILDIRLGYRELALISVLRLPAKYLPGGIAQATVRCKKKPQLLCSSGFFQCSFNGLDNQLGSVRSVR